MIKIDETTKKIEGVKVFYAYVANKISDEKFDLSTFCDQRKEEIATILDESLKRQKYYVWQLLLHALKENGANLDNTEFFKTPQGKWGCSFCEFSLSHSADVVAVALSEQPVGVDVEKIRPIHYKVVDRLLTEKIKEQLSTLPQEESQKLLLSEWCRRESVYKAIGGKTIFELNNAQCLQEEKIIRCDAEQYLLSVAYVGDKNAPNRVFFADYSDKFFIKY